MKKSIFLSFLAFLYFLSVSPVLGQKSSVVDSSQLACKSTQKYAPALLISCLNSAKFKLPLELIINVLHKASMFDETLVPDACILSFKTMYSDDPVKKSNLVTICNRYGKFLKLKNAFYNKNARCLFLTNLLKEQLVLRSKTRTSKKNKSIISKLIKPSDCSALITWGADINESEALHILADPFTVWTNKKHYLAKKLIALGADVNYKSKSSGRTPLHLACKGNKNTGLIKLLMSNGADASIQSLGDSNRTPIQLAAFVGNQNALETILDCIKDESLKRDLLRDKCNKLTAIEWFALSSERKESKKVLIDKLLKYDDKVSWDSINDYLNFGQNNYEGF